MSNTREQILTAARDAVQRGSFHGFSFQDLADQVGIKKGSMYYHFRSKDELAVEMLRDVRSSFREALSALEGLDLRSQLEGYVAIYSDHLDPGHKLCPGGAFAATWPVLGDDVRREVKRLIADHETFLRDAIAGAQERGEAVASGDPAELVDTFVAGIQGALLIARMDESPKRFGEIAARAVDALIAPAAAAS